MLRALEIRDILLIDRLELSFEPGLNVLTGETGAGKSILLDALGLALGWRGRADLTRPGAGEGEVTAVFELSSGHPARDVLDEAGLPAGDELILRRVAGSDGRKRAWVNDRRSSGEVLRALAARLVELHGQRDDRGLLDARGHIRLLDAFGGLDEQRRAVAAAWDATRSARAALEESEAALAAAREEEEFLRHSAGEIEALDPQPGEDAALDARRRAMQAAERIGTDIARAQAALGPGEGAEGRMGDAMRWLEGAAGPAEGRLDAPMAALERALVELGEATSGIETALSELSFDQGELEATEERLFALRALARKHQVGADDLPELAGTLRARLDRIEAGEDEIARRRAALAEAESGHGEAAAALSEARRAAGAALDARMAGELAPLKLAHARFATEISAVQPGPDGTDNVRFAVATTPDLPPGPIERVASGGEMARFLLALKVCLSDTAPGRAMIFDEIDRGLGGATAEAVGLRLARLAEGEQVLAITHSPQVAARAAHHFHVEKAQEADATLTRVRRLNDEARIDEIARMLAGAQITDAARDAARALLADLPA